ncbi:hypothetical protein [Microbispora sp. NBRC 16548]|uniref:hypothetical protein n=1 Tax=Microbispora sp. NBRC 16548 TaxID=3030994 RepID=UPI002556C0B2|nr:hypothetical protein [Microbispora sp. NBRC 16548]
MLISQSYQRFHQRSETLSELLVLSGQELRDNQGPQPSGEDGEPLSIMKIRRRRVDPRCSLPELLEFIGEVTVRLVTCIRQTDGKHPELFPVLAHPLGFLIRRPPALSRKVPILRVPSQILSVR